MRGKVARQIRSLTAQLDDGPRGLRLVRPTVAKPFYEAFAGPRRRARRKAARAWVRARRVGLTFGQWARV
jgi:hypothetical protein